MRVRKRIHNIHFNYLENPKTYRKDVLDTKCFIFLYFCSKQFSPPRIFNEIRVQTHAGLRVKSSLNVMDLNKNWTGSTTFRKILHHQISWTSVQRLSDETSRQARSVPCAFITCTSCKQRSKTKYVTPARNSIMVNYLYIFKIAETNTVCSGCRSRFKF
jgi:hypothetical protein